MQKGYFVKMIWLGTLLCLGGCAEQLQAINNALSTTNSALEMGSHSMKGNSSAPGGSGGSANTAPMIPLSPAQKEALVRHLTTKAGDAAIARAIEEAKPNIEKVLTISACYPGWDIDRYLAVYADRNAPFITPPMSAMKFHPKSQCLSIARLDGWNMAAKNALGFRAVYISDASGESISLSYQMVKQPDGVWLLH